MVIDKKVKIFLTILIIAINGCSSLDNIYKSVSVIKSDDFDRNSVIVDDFLNFIQKYYAPAKTTFILNIDKTKENLKFAQLFENRFRNAGYAISYKKIPNGVFLSWKIDRVGQLVRVTYYINKSVVTATYKRVGASWVAIGSFSALNMPTPKYNPTLLRELSSIKDHKLYAKVTANRLRIRQKPSINSRIVGYLNYGQKIQVSTKLSSRKNQEWIKIKHPNGYILSKYLKDLNE